MDWSLHYLQFVFLRQVEQRSELVDVVTRLAKEEAAAEKGAAAAAKADAAAPSFADMPEDLVAQIATRTNAAAALKQVKQFMNSAHTYCRSS